MGRSKTSQRIHGLAAEVAARWPGSEAVAEHEGGGAWRLSWHCGPTRQAVQARVEEALPGVRVVLDRTYCRRAYAIQALALVLDGTLRPGRFLADTVQARMDGGIAEPDQAEGRLAALADRLEQAAEQSGLPAWDERGVCDLVAERGVSWLLTPRQPKTDSADVLVMSPAEHLTHRFLPPVEHLTLRGSEEARAWHYRLQTLPARELVDRALAEETLDAADHLAVVGLLAQLRAEWEATEATALARAHEAGASWTDIGTALGITRQSAHARARRRSTGTPTRLSTQH